MRVVDKAVAVKPKRKIGLWHWVSFGVILGAFVGLLILGGLACAPDKITPSPSTEDATTGPSRLPQPSEQKPIMKISEYVESTNPIVRDTAVSAVQHSPRGIEADSEVWKIWQINYWVANNISYVSDPRGHDYSAYAHETLQTRGGDCDDFAILLASMYESVGLDAAIANIDTDDDWKADHMTCLVYYSKDGDSFIDEEKIILKILGLSRALRVYYFEPAGSKLLPEKYTTGMWIVADPTMAVVKDAVGYINHRPYQATSVIDVGGE
jgi:predicted transglutaminase-like cysteine proteinase